MKLIKILWANLAHATHAFHKGLGAHRMNTYSVKPPGKLLCTTAQIKCDCGKVFYENKDALKQFNAIQGE